MFQQSDAIRRLNMKIAGTLQQSTQPDEKKEEKKDSGAGQNSVYGDVSFEGLTAKQKKNLKKKLLKKRKKLERSQNTSNLNISRSTDNNDDDDEDEEREKDSDNDPGALDLDIKIDDVTIADPS
jgi:hypothetical protein